MNVEISGNLRGPTVVFLAGWPDSSDVFRTNLMAHLSTNYRIVGITMPGYSDASPFMKAYRQGFLEARKAQREYDKQRRAQRLFRRRGAHRRSLSRVAGQVCHGVLGPLPFGRQVAEAVFPGHGDGCGDSASDSDGNEDDDLIEEPIEMMRYQLENDDEPMQTPLFGHGFQDLVRLLEIAVDSAMEIHNECPPAFLATSIVDAHNPVQGIPAHQLPPYYPRPAIVAHGWGVQLVFELLLSRPTYFSRIIALDAGAAVFESSQRRLQVDHPGSDAGTPQSPHTPFQPANASLSVSTAKGAEVSHARSNQPTSYLSHTATAKPTGTSDSPLQPGAPVSAAGAPVTRNELHVQGDLPSLSRRSGHCIHAPSDGESTELPVTAQLPPTRSATGIFPAATSHHRLDAMQELFEETRGRAPQDMTMPPSSPKTSGVADGPHSPLMRVTQQRSLASRYAIRPKKTNAVKTTNVRNMWQRIGVFIYQLLIISCTFTIPRFLARWILLTVLWLAGRPRYTVNPHIVLTPDNEAFNQKLYQQYRLHASFIMAPSQEDSWNPLQQQPYQSHPSFYSRGSAFPEGSFPQPSDGEERYTLCQTDDGNSHSQGGVGLPRVAYRSGRGMPSAERGSQGTGRALPGQCLPGSFRIPATGDWHIVLVPFLRNPNSHHDDGNRPPPYANRRTNLQRGKVSLPDKESPSGASPKAGVVSRLLGLHGKSSSVANTGVNTSANTIDVGFTMAQDIPRWGSAVGNSLESITSVSPYRAYRNYHHTVYDNPVPSASMQPPPTSVGARAAGRSRAYPYSALAGSFRTLDKANDASGGTGTTRWCSLPNDSLSPSHDGSYVNWRSKEVYYRTFVIPPRADGVRSDETDRGEVSTRTRTPTGTSTVVTRQSTGSRQMRRRRQKEHTAEVLPAMGWIYLQYWWGVFLSILFSPSARSQRRKPITNDTVERRGSADRGAGGPISSTGNGMGTSYGGEEVAGAYSPLVSQRFFFPVAVPVLFMYGANKPFMLHSAQWCDYVKYEKRSEDGISDVVEVQGGGHWFFAEKKYQKKVAERVAEFIMAKAS